MAKKKKQNGFPDTLFVARVDEDGDSWFTAQTNSLDCLEDDGPTVVGVYELKETRRVMKVVETTDVRSVG